MPFQVVFTEQFLFEINTREFPRTNGQIILYLKRESYFGSVKGQIQYEIKNFPIQSILGTVVRGVETLCIGS